MIFTVAILAQAKPNLAVSPFTPARSLPPATAARRPSSPSWHRRLRSRRSAARRALVKGTCTRRQFLRLALHHGHTVKMGGNTRHRSAGPSTNRHQSDSYQGYHGYWNRYDYGDKWTTVERKRNRSSSRSRRLKEEEAKAALDDPISSFTSDDEQDGSDSETDSLVDARQAQRSYTAQLNKLKGLDDPATVETRAALRAKLRTARRVITVHKPLSEQLAVQLKRKTANEKAAEDAKSRLNAAEKHLREVEEETDEISSEIMRLEQLIAAEEEMQKKKVAFTDAMPGVATPQRSSLRQSPALSSASTATSCEAQQRFQTIETQLQVMAQNMAQLMNIMQASHGAAGPVFQQAPPSQTPAQAPCTLPGLPAVSSTGLPVIPPLPTHGKQEPISPTQPFHPQQPQSQLLNQDGSTPTQLNASSQPVVVSEEDVQFLSSSSDNEASTKVSVSERVKQIRVRKSEPNKDKELISARTRSRDVKAQTSDQPHK